MDGKPCSSNANSAAAAPMKKVSNMAHIKDGMVKMEGMLPFHPHVIDQIEWAAFSIYLFLDFSVGIDHCFCTS